MALDRKSRTARLRVTKETLKRWKEAADASGLTLSEWIRIRADGADIKAQPPKAV